MNTIKAKATLTAALVFLFGASAAMAVPVLQIDIDGASYVGGGEESVVTTDSEFDLYALGTPGGHTSSTELLEGVYYLSVAIIPQIGPTPEDFGSFVINGTTYDVNDLVYGTPPVDLYTGDPEAGLAGHDIYDTFYLQLAVSFTGADTASTYNVQDDAGTIASHLGGSGSYYDMFHVDIGGLLEGYDLHFDLYDAVVANGPTGAQGDLDEGIFAPFSHDARTGGGDCCTKVPEPGSLALLGLGLLGIGLRRRFSFNV